MLIGALLSTETLGPADDIWGGGGFTCPTGNVTTTKSMGTFVMPFAGSLVADGWVRGTWSGPSAGNYIRVQIAGTSTPTPSRFSNHAWWPGGNFGAPTPAVGFVEMSAVWDSLPKGTSVTLLAAVTVGAATTSSFNASSATVLVRAVQP
jgi:hypothetical protein